MAEATIDSLKLEIESSSNGASKGLDDLSKSLKKLQKATSKGIGLTAVVNDLKTANTGIGSSLDGISRAVDMLSKLGGVKISASIGNQIKSISDALKSADFSGSSAKMQELATALEPLQQLGKSNLSSYVTQLKKLPEVMKELNKLDIGAVSAKMQELATALKPLGDEMQKVANGFSAFPAKIQKLIASTDKLSKSNKNASSSYINLYAKLKMAATGVKTFANKIASWITLSSDYTETMNLFTVSMGEYAEEAYNYAQIVGDAMGIDPAEWMRNEGVFMTLTKGFGVVGDRANTMSQQLTQLGYDLSSFFNISVADAMTKLQSGISGELEPLRRLGYDLSQAKLEATALSLGIDKAVSSMTQAEKAELRYYAIMTQVTDAHGDMARTLNAPANQMRILNAQVTQLGRALGNFFIPLLNKVLPYAIASVKVLREVLDVFMDLLGIELANIDFGKGSITSVTDSVTDGLDDATESAKKLKSYMMGFDELNVINPDEGSGSGLEGLGTGFDFELPTYDFMEGIVDTQIGGIVEKMKEWLGITEDINSWTDLFGTKLGDILTTVGLIAVGIGAWKISTGVIEGVNAILALGTGGALAASIAGIVVGIPAYFVGIYDACVNGIDWLSASLIGVGATAAGAGIGAIIGMLGGPIGAGIGALIGLAIGAITDFTIWLWQNFDKVATWFKGLPGWAQVLVGVVGTIGGSIYSIITGVITIIKNWDTIVESIQGAFSSIGQFFVNAWNTIVGVWNKVANWFNTWVITPVKNFFTGMWNGIKSAAQSCWDGIKTVFNPVVNWFSKLFNSVKQTISDVFYNIGVIAKGCWEIIKGVWKVVSTWFSEKVITPVKTAFTSAWNSISSKANACWGAIKGVFLTASGWFNEKVITPVKNAFTGIWSKLKEGAKSAWSGIKSVFSSVATFFKDTFTKAWEGVKKVFSTGGKIFEGIKDGIVSAFKSIVNSLIKGINKVVSVPFNGINDALKKLKGIEIFGKKPFGDLKTISVPEIPLLAKGGMIENNGQLFIAREQGPELVSNIGGKTAVMNNDQIVESVSIGVYQAVLAALGSGSSDEGSTNIVINLDGEKIYENQQKIARGRGYNLGMGAFSFG